MTSILTYVEFEFVDRFSPHILAIIILGSFLSIDDISNRSESTWKHSSLGGTQISCKLCMDGK